MLMRLFLSSLLLVVFSAMSFAMPDNDREIAKMREVADSLHSIGHTDSAAIVGQQTIDLAAKNGNPTQIVGTRSAQGVFLRSLGRIDEALECYDGALEIITSGSFRENPDQEAIEEIASLYINLSVLKLDTQLKDQASESAQLTEKAAFEDHDPLGYYLLGYMCYNEETPDQATGGPRQEYDWYDAERFYEICAKSESKWRVPACLWLGDFFMNLKAYHDSMQD